MIMAAVVTYSKICTDPDPPRADKAVSVTESVTHEVFGSRASSRGHR